MTTILQSAVAQGLLATALILPGVAGLVDTGDLESLQKTYEKVRETRSEVADGMESLEQRYQKLVKRITAKKRANDGSSKSDELKKLIRRARGVSQKLEKRRSKLETLDKRLRRLRDQIVTEVEKLEKRIESKLDDVSGDKRKKLVKQLNRLRSVHQRHHVPLPDAPDDKAVSKTLEMASRAGSNDPEQMATAADAIEDTEQQVRERLDAVRNKLKSLRQTRNLARRAETVRSQQQLFDENQRPRAVARSSSDSASRESSDDSSSGASESEPSAAPSDPKEGTGDSDESSAAQPPRSPNSRFNGDKKTSDREETPKTAPPDDSSTSGSDQPFESDDSMVVERDADPSANVSDSPPSPSELSRRIQQLERERNQLKKQAEELEEKAETLRSKAKELKELD